MSGARGWTVWIFIAAAFTAAEQVRSEEPAVTLFALPHIELRREVTLTDADAVEAQTDELAKVEAMEELSVSTERAAVASEISIQVYETMNGEPVLGRMEIPDEPGGALGWLQTEVLDPVFSVEVVKVGKVQMSGGVVTAIKRKNPFCLLHPLVFVASW